MARILVIDDEPSLRQLLTLFLTKVGHEVETAVNGLQGLERLQTEPFDLALTDLRMPRMGGLDLLDVLRERKINVQVIVMTAYSSTETALEAMRKGAYDYVVKPMNLKELKLLIDKCLEKGSLIRENRQLRENLKRANKPQSTLIYKSTHMAEVEALVERIAPTPSNVLILGESGTGKEVVARLLHHRSPRRERPFVAVNCGAIPDQLMESELFGHSKGAFTGATKDKKGLFEAAQGGTILFDEIGELGLGLQVKLLRVLQERVITPVGTTEELPIDVRVVAATHNDLRAAVQEGTFRADLFYRLNVIELKLPALRDRPEDIPVLAAHFLERMNRRLGRSLNGFEPEALRVLSSLPYHGNVRELENVIERAVALETGPSLTAAWLPDPGSTLLRLRSPALSDPQEAGPIEPETLIQHLISGAERWLEGPDAVLDIDRLLAKVEEGLLRAALQRTGNNKTEAASLLKMSFRSFRYKLAKHEDAAR